MASPTQWTWVWVNSGSWWWTGRLGMLWFIGLQRVGHYWVTELNWTELKLKKYIMVIYVLECREHFRYFWLVYFITDYYHLFLWRYQEVILNMRGTLEPINPIPRFNTHWKMVSMDSFFFSPMDLILMQILVY